MRFIRSGERIAVFYLLAVVASSGQARAQGGPPLETDDPGTVLSRRWEINTAIGIERTARATEYETPLVDINFGWRPGLQLKLEAPWRILHGPASGNRSGVGSVEIGVKWRFHDDARTRFAISTYPQLSVGDTNSFLRKADVAELFLPIQVSRSWGSFGLNAEGGYRLVKGGSPEIVLGLAAGRGWSTGLELLSECHGTTANRFAGLTLLCQLGVRQPLGTHVNFLGAIGAAPIGPPEDRTTLHLYLGVQSHW